MTELDNQTTTFACNNCGADLKYQPGTVHLKCEYCGTDNEIPQPEEEIEELDFHAYLSDKTEKEEKLTIKMSKCTSCGATSSIESHIHSSACPYCNTPLIIEEAHDEQVIQPKSLLPFKLDKKQGHQQFKKWLKKLWFAPNDLKKATLNFEQFKGVYIPYWTFDSDTDSVYTGQRGTHYYVSESYTTTENGKTVTKTRQVRKTRWRNVSGRVRKLFDDVLTVASKSLPRKYIYKLEPWDLENLVPFDKKYLSGFITEKYQIDLEGGFEIAKGIMDEDIRRAVRRDIGGDEQRIFTLNTRHNDITFKHLLLPVYVCAYRYKKKVYQFLVNGRTGEVQGQRPYSAWKIALLVIVILIIAAAIYFLTQQSGTTPATPAQGY